MSDKFVRAAAKTVCMREKDEIKIIPTIRRLITLILEIKNFFGSMITESL